MQCKKQRLHRLLVESIRHKDKRANIPTEELRDFVAEDEQDGENLAVPVVPIYIQEKLHPQAIIDALPRIERAGDKQINLFADFNGGPAAQ